jgi:hypothetical protein
MGLSYDRVFISRSNVDSNCHCKLKDRPFEFKSTKSSVIEIEAIRLLKNLVDIQTMDNESDCHR